MTDNNQIITPSGMSGLQRYNEQTGSKLQIKPEYVLILIVLVVIGMAGIKMLLPIY
jgi:preprotein translocase subunit Sec61beta